MAGSGGIELGIVTLVPVRIAVVGGGFTGVAFVLHLIRTTHRPLDITIIEPAAVLGRGLAYGTSDPGHRINVPTHRMGLFADDPGLATRWFFAQGVLPDAACESAPGDFYVSRQGYGRFMSDLLASTLHQAGARVAFRHETSSAVGVSRDAPWRVTLTTGGAVEADLVVLSFGHSAPVLPCPIEAGAQDHPKFIANPWAAQALAALDRKDEVLVVGTGLTMADMVSSLLPGGHAGPITAISRRGMLPRGQGSFINDLDVFDGHPKPHTALGLLRLVRRCARRYGPSLGWQPAIDSVRLNLPALWAALPAAEKQRVVKRLLPFWEVHRFRMAPQVSTIITEALNTGRLTIARAALLGVARRDGRFVATLGNSGGTTREHVCDGVILCTGPNMRANPLFMALIEERLARPDDIGLGLAVDPRSRVLDAEGLPQTGLLALGPLTRGSFGEMSGAPDISRHIARLVVDVLAP